jgi:flagellar motor switch protein FliM
MTNENISLHFRCLLGKAILSEESFAHLKEGDIILLDQKLSQPLEVRVNEEKLFKAYAGAKNRRKAVQIL